jgi:hypothetical protein
MAIDKHLNCLPRFWRINAKLTQSRYWFLTMTLLMPLATVAKNSDLAERIIPTYSSLESYCDIATVVGSASSVKHCVRKDGRFKSSSIESDGSKYFAVRWADARAYHWYSGSTQGSYLRAIRADRWMPGDISPILISILNWYPITYYGSLSSLTEQLSKFEPRPDLSNESVLAYENTELSSIVWVDRNSGLIHRIQGTLSGHVEISDIRLNQSLQSRDLEHPVPITLLVRHEATDNTGLILLTGCVMSFLLGFVYWRNARHRSRQTSIALRTNSGRAIFARLAAIATVPTFLYALFRPTGESAFSITMLVGTHDWLALYIGLLLNAGLFVASKLLIGAVEQQNTPPTKTPKVASKIDNPVRPKTTTPYMLVIVGTISSAVVFWFAATQPLVSPGDHWPSHFSNLPGALTPDTLHLDILVSILCISLFSICIAWLYRHLNKWRIVAVLLVAFFFNNFLVWFNYDPPFGLETYYGAPFEWTSKTEWMQNHAWSNFNSAGLLANILTGFALSTLIVFIAEQCFRKKLHWPAVGTMAATAYIAYEINNLWNGNGYGGSRGWPFTLYASTDVGGGVTNYSAAHANIGVALFVVAGTTAITEWLYRHRNHTFTASTLIVAMGLATILVAWVSGSQFFFGSGILGDHPPIEWRGFPFGWAVHDDLLRTAWFGAAALFGNMTAAYLIVGAFAFKIWFVIRLSAKQSIEIAAESIRQ